MLEISALLTEEAARRQAEHETEGKAFKIVGFSLGNAGHDPSDPTLPLSPDPTLTTCQTPVFGPKAVSGYTFANNFCPIWECFIDRGEGAILYSSLCLLAQIVSSPIPGDPEVNSTFLYAVANFSQRPKADDEMMTIRVGVQR